MSVTIPPRGRSVTRVVGPGRSLRGRRSTAAADVGDHGAMADVPPGSPDKDLRRDIRRVTSILGETLARTEGEHLLALVEQVRAHAKEDRLDQPPDFDLATITRLVRAFTAYFHLANITEQVHRGRTLTRLGEAEGGWLEQAVARIAEAGTDPDDVAGVLGELAMRPVFTAHPTEVARRSTIDKLRRVAALLEEPDSPRRTRRLEEAVELLWLTDEIRIEPPGPTDEARNVVYSLEGLSAGALPDVLEELRDRLATIGVDLPTDVRPLRFGSWVGGDRDGNPHVTPATTREVLTLQAVHGTRLLRTLGERLRRELSVSDHVSSVSDELTERIGLVLPSLPEVAPRYRRLNAEDPYRLFLTCVHVRLGLTEQRILDGTHHVPGRDSADDTELLDDLLLLHRSVLAHQGGVVASAQVERLVRK